MLAEAYFFGKMQVISSVFFVKKRCAPVCLDPKSGYYPLALMDLLLINCINIVDEIQSAIAPIDNAYFGVLS
jgi:hypothetical protein